MMAALLLAVSAMRVHAQPILTFDFAGAAGNEATWASNANDPGLTGSIISRGPGILALADADRFNAKHWTTGSAPDLTDYMEFTITPQPGKLFTITKVTFKLQRNNRGPLRYVLRTSADGFTTNKGSVAILVDNTTTQTRNFTFTMANRTSPLVLRLYGYQAEYVTAGHAGPGDATGADIIVHGTTADITWYSRANGNVSDPIWSLNPAGTPGPATFSALTHMVVQNGHTVTNTGNVTVKDLGVDAGGTLVLNSGTTCTILGDAVTVNGTLTGSDNTTLDLAGAAATTVGGSGGTINLWDLAVNSPAGVAANTTIGIRGTLQLNDGAYNATGGTTTLLSTATGTGRLGQVASGANYTGNLTVQRYIPAGHTNWRMLGSPVAGQTVNEWKDDFFTAGFPGSHYPNFYDPPNSGIFWPSIRWYDETNTYASADSGEVGVSSTAQALTPGQGFRAWCGDTYAGTNAFTVDLTGAPTIAQSPFTLPLSFTSSGSVPADGWNLVANPLPSPIDFTAISRGSDVQNAYWIFDPATGNTFAWSNGVGQGGLNGILQSSQGFWMKADGTNLTSTLDESAKVAEPIGGTFGGSLQPVLPILDLTVASDLNTYSDKATVIFAQGSPALDGIDALKLPFKTAGAPKLSVQSTTGERLAMDFYGNYGSAVQIPVMVDVDVTGTYTITAAMMGPHALSCLSLTDLRTGAVTPLTDGASYSFSINADDDATQPRFMINGTKPVPFYVENALCPGGEGTSTVVATDGSLGVTWADAAGNPLSSMLLPAGDVGIFHAVAGNYQVRITPGGACGTLVGDFTIHAPAGDAPVAAFHVAETTITAGAPVHFLQAGSPEAGYLWHFGDGSTSTEADPAHAYLQPGTYTVTLTATNGDCSDSFSADVAVENATGIHAADAIGNVAVWGSDDQLIITHGFGNAPVQVDVFDATGRLALSRSAIAQPERITLRDGTLHTGIWLVRITSGDVQRTFRVPLVR